MPLLTDVEGDGANVVNQQRFRTKIAWDDEVVAKKTPDFFFASADSADCTAGPLPHLCVPLKAPWLEVETLHPASAWAGWKRKAAGAGSTMRAWVASTPALSVGRGRSAVPS